ncbi:unnamed protein product [Rodentolepis nana]|uniref:DAGKc domain-containing protein n=1 Tax=Rodentolepis nana TaxID=102285 RepID=A0A0R3TKW8_RODNA|nr:unnamed protein product [Rodentolepis nana]
MIETQYILSVKCLEVSKTCCNVDVSHHQQDKIGLVIRSIDRSCDGIWKIQTWNLICDPDNVHAYYNEIKLFRKLWCKFTLGFSPNRPQSLLVFINPYGGKRKAEIIYYSNVRPIFDLAGIRSKVICKVVCVGGDGLFSELLLGLLYRTRKEAKLPLYDNHKPFTTELSPRLKIGLIPAGSTNAVVRSLHGTEDVETAAIHIALGLDIGVDVLGVHDASTEGFLRYIVTLLGYGFHGDLLDPSERMRFLGPTRYDIAGEFLDVINIRVRFRLRITALSMCMDYEPHQQRITVFIVYYHRNGTCPICLKQEIESGEAGTNALDVNQTHQPPANLIEPPSLQPSHRSDPPQSDSCSEPEVNGARDLVRNAEHPDEWHTASGEFVAVNAFLISCRCAKSPLGPAPSAHLGDGHLDLILVRRCSRWQFLSYLSQLTNKRKDRSTRHLKMPFVEAHRVKAFRLQALDDHGDPINNEEIGAQKVSVWSVDGEVLKVPNVICW